MQTAVCDTTLKKALQQNQIRGCKTTQQPIVKNFTSLQSHYQNRQ